MGLEVAVTNQGGELARPKNHGLIEGVQRGPVAEMHQVRAGGVFGYGQLVNLPEAVLTSVNTGPSNGGGGAS